MRALTLLAAGLALTACSKDGSQDNRTGSDASITAENIVSNDVTAIDAVTGDAANLAEAAEINDIGPALDAEELNAAAASKPAARPKASPKADSKPARESRPSASTATSNSSE